MTKLRCQNKFKTTNIKTSVLAFVICALVLFCHLCFGIFYYSFASEIKEPNVAGEFYPQNPAELSQMIDKMAEKASPEIVNGEIFALIMPHAGYGYSGPTASLGYRLIKNKPYKTVVIIGTSHKHAFAGVSVYPQGAFRTPLGDLEIDKDFCANLLQKDEEISFYPEAFSQEHSVEVQLPFLQSALSGFKIVPIVMGDCTLVNCKKLARLLKDAIGARKDVLIIVSTDMYHGYDYNEAKKTDALTLTYMKNMDYESLYYGLRDEKLQLCGGFGVVATLVLAKELGYNNFKLLGFTNSTEVTGNKNINNWVVGYSSSMITRQEVCLSAGSPAGLVSREEEMLNKEQRSKLLKIARESIETYLKTGKKKQVSETDPALLKKAGAFVTLNEHGDLRGCIGNLAADGSLYITVRDMAIEAATGDPRFSALSPSETKDIEIEISVLSPMQKIDNPDKIRMGEHGVLIKKGFNSGVFLPQVATETGWSREEFLTNLCVHKAGIPAEAWKDKNTEIYIFSAEVFSEKDK